MSKEIIIPFEEYTNMINRLTAFENGESAQTINHLHRELERARSDRDDYWTKLQIIDIKYNDLLKDRFKFWK